MTTVLTSIGEVITWLTSQMMTFLLSLVASPYFMFTIIFVFSVGILGVILRLFKSFGLRRGGRKRR